MIRPILLAAILSLPAAAALAAGPADPQPEIRRAPSAPQAVGTVHTLRVIPEACARLEGQFTGVAANPYRFAAVRTGERCQARARLTDATTAKASTAGGWVLNDVIRVPRAGCASQQAVVRVWRKAANAVPPKLDAQGRSRIYLKDSLDAARGGDLGPIPVYATDMRVEGLACR